MKSHTSHLKPYLRRGFGRQPHTSAVRQRGFTPTPISSRKNKTKKPYASMFAGKSNQQTQKEIGVSPAHAGRGFTLIELIVALGLFIVVSFIAAGALLSIVDANRKANAIRTTMDNLNFALESMTRDIRTGGSFDCGFSGGQANCPLSSGGASRFSFVGQNGNTVTYSTSSDAQYPREDVIYVTTDGEKSPLTASDVSITNLRFYVSQVGSAVSQPRVIMVVQGEAGIQERVFTTFNVQSTVTRRGFGG